MKGWDENAIKRTNLATKSTLVHKSVLPKQTPAGLAFIAMTLSINKVDFVPEYKFLENRRFRFDLAIPSLKIAFEYEGIFSDVSRHTSIKGYTNDIRKYNLATLNGWRVLRYTAMNYKEVIEDLYNILNQ